MLDFSVLYDDAPTEEEELLAVYQELVDTGMAWRMEGSVGRAAMDLLRAGKIVLGPVGHRDYWGNYVPSRHEVKPGTMGSVEYAEAMAAEDEA